MEGRRHISSDAVVLVSAFLLVVSAAGVHRSVRLVGSSSTNWTVADACDNNTLVGSVQAFIEEGMSITPVNGSGAVATFSSLTLLNATADVQLFLGQQSPSMADIWITGARAAGRYRFQVTYRYVEPIDLDDRLNAVVPYAQTVAVVPEFTVLVGGSPADGATLYTTRGEPFSVALGLLSLSRLAIAEVHYSLTASSEALEYFGIASLGGSSPAVIANASDRNPPTRTFEAVLTAMVSTAATCEKNVTAAISFHVLPRISNLDVELHNDTAVKITWVFGAAELSHWNFSVTISQDFSDDLLYFTSQTMLFLSPIPALPADVTVAMVASGIPPGSGTSQKLSLSANKLVPQPPTNVTAVIDSTTGALTTLSWEPSASPGSINYTIIVRTVTAGVLTIPVGAATAYKLTEFGLKEESIEKISVIARNLFGEGPETEKVHPTSFPAQPTTASPGPVMSTEIVVGAAGGFLLLVFLLLLLCVGGLTWRLWRSSGRRKVHWMKGRDRSVLMSHIETDSTKRLYEMVDSEKYKTLTLGGHDATSSTLLTAGGGAWGANHTLRPLPRAPEEEPIYQEIPASHRDQYQQCLRAKRAASTSHHFRPLWHPLTGQLDAHSIGPTKIGGGSALKKLGQIKAMPGDYDKTEVYNVFEKVYHADATGKSLLTCFELRSDQITMLDPIGQGAFGRVYKACARNILPDEKDTLVAVKILKEETSEQATKDFKAEAQLLAHFGHPYILSLLGVCTQGFPLMVVTPYFKNGSLKSFLRSKKSAVEEGGIKERDSHSMFIMSEQIASGMEYLASRFFIHRDLAARNILIGDNLHCVISDFGMCRVLAREKGYFEMQSSGRLPLKWMAPESVQLSRFSTYSDVWSFGVVMWEIASWGESPLKNIATEDLIEFILSGRRMEQPIDCPDSLYSMMRRCWEENPVKRPIFSELRKRLSELKKCLNIRSVGLSSCTEEDEENPYI